MLISPSQTNVKSIYIAAQAFIATANPSATFISVNAAGAVLPASIGAGLTGYMTSKIAAAKLIEYLAHEHPHLFVYSVHPGVIDTNLLRKAGLHESKLPQDTVELPAHFMVWLSGKAEKGYLRGRLVWCNWDVEELGEMATRIEEEELFSVGMIGYPFGQKPITGSVR